MRSATAFAVLAAASCFTANPLAAQDAAFPNDAADALYCEQRKLGYWFYCVRPGPEPSTTAPQPQPHQAQRKSSTRSPASCAS